jgi:hypothetical protein
MREKKTVSINLRLPEDVHARLREVAEEEDRALNSQVIRFIRWGFERYDTERARLQGTSPDQEPETHP